MLEGILLLDFKFSCVSCLLFNDYPLQGNAVSDLGLDFQFLLILLCIIH